MKAIVYREIGDPSVLKLIERDVPEPGPGEVRIRIHASGVNPTDWRAPSSSEWPMPYLEVTPHHDAGGVIDAVGPGVETFAPGDRVWVMSAGLGYNTGTAQELTVLPTSKVWPLPENASFEVGAALGIPALTAHRALTVAEGAPRRLAPKALDGFTVLVTGGAGAVGHATIQLARWAGATVITTVSGPEKAALATAAGAHHVVNYREGDPVAEIRAVAQDGVDVVVEVAVAENLDVDLAVLKNSGTIAVYNDDNPKVELNILQNIGLDTRFHFLLALSTDERMARMAGAADDVTAAVLDGAMGVGEEHGLPVIRFPLAETAAAHLAAQNGAVGKVIVDPTA
ncbi:NADPH:quinone reductase [Nonomuraea glycinis]|uniref:NADPH:quinone reductase n=1 Tax=Nonomuraea glycinis TaxID=2047744 RepID=A0A918A2T0_9ACTN|nr:NADPH:quinone reductase [Nonomuraea glycinis]MCA2175748.1 NADPH:quinone reductase [Nonomuraea glycinis]GGP05303.1 NADPH:quinone reductase [Nonomuraea glycinis]